MAWRVHESKTDVVGCKRAATCKMGGKSFRMCQRKRDCKIERLEHARTRGRQAEGRQRQAGGHARGKGGDISSDFSLEGCLRNRRRDR